MPIHLRPSAPTASAAILCGDPSRALTIAQAVLPQPRMSNHHRGLWGYWGEMESGAALTVQATGIGGPSAVTVLAELEALGLRRAVRVGTCAVPGSDWAPGSAFVVGAAVAGDGTSVALGARPGSLIAPDAGLTRALLTASGAPETTVVSRDLQLTVAADPRPADLQTAATLAFCSRRGIPAAAVLAVAAAAGRRLEDEPLDAALLDLARAAARVLTERAA